MEVNGEDDSGIESSTSDSTSFKSEKTRNRFRLDLLEEIRLNLERIEKRKSQTNILEKNQHKH